MLKKCKTHSPQETQKLGRKMAQEFLARQKLGRRAFVIGLEGDLGGGKTTFVQGFARGLGIKERILSPTFVILKRFKIPKARRASCSVFRDLYHIDCYRVKKAKELLDLGFKEMLSNPENIVIIEWADKVKKILPKETVFLKFNFVSIKKREIIWTKKD